MPDQLTLTLVERETPKRDAKTRHRASAKRYAQRLRKLHGAAKTRVYKLMVHHIKAMLR